MDSFKTYTTSQLADAAEVGSQTLRYYERRGLLPEPPRTSGGHRIYGDEHLRILHFIQRAQGLGFHLQEIHELLNLRVVGDQQYASVARTASRVIDRIEEKVETLAAMREALEELRDACERSEPTEGFPVLDALAMEPA